MSQGNQAQANPPSQGPSTLTFVPQPLRLELADAENLSTTWRTWKRRWNAFAAVSGLNANQDDEYKTGMLVSVADDETLNVIDSLPYAASGDRKKIDKIIELFEKHCLQDVNKLFERHRFIGGSRTTVSRLTNLSESFECSQERASLQRTARILLSKWCETA